MTEKEGPTMTEKERPTMTERETAGTALFAIIKFAINH